MHTAATLQDWLRGQLASGLPALAGTRIAGTVPVQVDLLNQVIASVLAGVARPGAGATGTATMPVDLQTLARLVRRVRVDAAPGVVTLDFEIGIGG
jgi:Na+/serine symporter